MSDLTDAVNQSEEGVTEPQELGGQSSTSTDTKDDDFVTVDAKGVPSVESTTSESISMDGISQASTIQASGEKGEQDGPGDGGTAEVREEKKVKGAMSDLTDTAVKQSKEGVTEPQEQEVRTYYPPKGGPGDGGTAEVQEEKKVKGAMSDLTDAAVKPNEESVTKPKELGGQSSTSTDTKDDDWVAVDAKDVTPVAEVQEEKVKGAMEDDGGEQERMRVEEEERQKEERRVEDEILREEEMKRAEEEKQREEEKKREEEERRSEEEKKREEEERLREEEIKRAEEEKQREEEKKREEEQRLREEEKKGEGKKKREEENKREEEERQREEEIKRAEEEKQREEEKKREEEERRREEEVKRVEEEKQREKEKKREEEKRRREGEMKRAEEERQREEERKRAEGEMQREEEMKAIEVKTDEDRQREGSAKVEEGEGTDEADQAIGTETIPTPAEVSEGTELTRRKVASKETLSESTTDQGESMVHGESKGPATSSDGSMWIYGSIVTLIVISVFIVGFIIFTKAPPSVPAPDETAHSDMGDCLRKRSERLEVLYEEIESLSKKFPSLDQPSLDTIAGASWAHVQDKEELVRPVVLLLVSQPDHDKANDVAEEVANMYFNVYHESRGDIVRVDGDDFEDGTTDQVKKDIDAKIKAGLKGCAHVVIIKDLDELQPCSIILFHAYCDNDGAPYKDAVFIFTMTLDDTIPEDTTKLETEKIIQEHLEEHLRQCPEEFPKDKIAAMNSRLANNIVMLN